MLGVAPRLTSPRVKPVPDYADPVGRELRVTMANDTVRIMCPNLTCRKVLAVPASARGKTVRCRNCSTSIRVPAFPAAGKGTPTSPTDSAPAKPGS